MGKKNASQLNNLKIRPCDFWIVMITISLIVFGVIMVFSASYYYAISRFDNPYHYLIRDTIWAIAACGVMAVVSVVDYHVISKFAPAVTIFSIATLFLLFTPMGITRNNATRWLNVGVTFMPGEFAKLGAILFVSWYLSQNPKLIKSPRGLMVIGGLAGIYFILIYKQPNLSTAITVVGIMCGIAFIAGLPWKIVGTIIGGAVAAVALFVSLGSDENFHYRRMTSFLDPFADKMGDGYQVVQGLLALGSGGLFGKGPGQSIQKSLYLPEPQNDFILAIIGEELGFVTIVILLCVYLLLIWRGVRVAINAKDLLGTLMASGVVIMIALQVILNVAVVTSSMPPTGITLPFISYGGNALMIFAIATGILLNISRQAIKQ